MNSNDFYRTINSSFKKFGSKLKIEHSKGHEHLNYNCFLDKERGFGLNDARWDGNFVLFLHEDSLNVARTHSKDLLALLKIAYLWVDEQRSLLWIKENHISIELFQKIIKPYLATEKNWNHVKNAYFSRLDFYEDDKRKRYASCSNLIAQLLKHNKLSNFIPALSHASLFLSPPDYGNNPRYFIYQAENHSIKIFNVDYQESEDFITIDASFDSFDVAFDYYLSLIRIHKDKI